MRAEGERENESVTEASAGRGDERRRVGGETNLVVGGMKANTVCVWLIRPGCFMPDMCD